MFLQNYKEFPDKSGIYKITTIHNNLSYIGSALSLRKRMKDHRNDLKRGDCHCDRLQKVFNKYGKEDFKVEFIKVHGTKFKLNSPEYKSLLQEEEDFITKLDPKYNSIKKPTTQINNPSTSKKVYQYDKFGNFLKEWESGREVTRQLGIQPLNGLKGKNRSSGGFQWSYEKRDKLERYKSNSGTKRKVRIEKDHIIKDFNSITNLVEFFGGGRSIYQRVLYAIKVGKLLEGWKIIYC